MSSLVELRPQPGPQEMFHRCSADIAIFGGSAGPGKSWSLVLEPTRWIEHGDFRGVIFRRTHPELVGANSVWEYACAVYRPLGAALRESPRDARFPSGATVEFNHLQLERTVHTYQSKGWELIEFDELVHFTEQQFWYMVSRNRSVSGRRPYIRAATNPHAESWVRGFVDWWIGPDGLPIPERSGVKRWLARVEEQLEWASSKDELELLLRCKYPKMRTIPKPHSVTFIGALVEDNPALLNKDPGYISRLELLPLVERLRLRGGNWNVKATAGLVFQDPWFGIVESVPEDAQFWVRAWDLAGTDKTKGNDPAFTVGSKWCKTTTGRLVVTDVVRFQGSPLKVEQAVLRAARQDGENCAVALWRDPGQAGKAQESHYLRLLAGFGVRFIPATEDKVTYALPYSAQCEGGNVALLRAAWNKEWIAEHVGFPDQKFKDQVDSGSLAVRWLAHYGRVLGARST